jgi:hypothetical protein
MGWSAALLFGGWLVASSLLSAAGSYRSRLGHGVPWLPVAIFGFFGMLLALTRVPAISRALTAPGAQQRLLWPHSFRAGGIVFVIAMLLGKLPALFAVPAGFGDIAVGLANESSRSVIVSLDGGPSGAGRRIRAPSFDRREIVLGRVSRFVSMTRSCVQHHTGTRVRATVDEAILAAGSGYAGASHPRGRIG